MKVKKSAIGKSIFHKKIGFFTINENHAPLLFRIGKVEFLDGLPATKKLTPKKAAPKKNNNVDSAKK